MTQNDISGPQANRRRERPAVAPLRPILVGIDEAAAMLGVGRTLITELMAAGKFPEPVKLGARILWRVAELEAWAAAGCPTAEKWTAMQKAGAA